MTQITTHGINILNVQNEREEALLIAEAEALGGEHTLEEFFIHSEKMLANLGK